MKIAVTYKDGEIFPHFGKTEQFKIYDVQDGKVGPGMVTTPAGGGHGALAGFLRMLGIRVLLCGGIGPGAVEALTGLGVAIVPGLSGSADQAAEDFAAGKFAVTPDNLTEYKVSDFSFGCGHHGHGEGGCGSHEHGGGCASHGCGNQD